MRHRQMRWAVRRCGRGHRVPEIAGDAVRCWSMCAAFAARDGSVMETDGQRLSRRVLLALRGRDVPLAQATDLPTHAACTGSTPVHRQDGRSGAIWRSRHGESRLLPRALPGQARCGTSAVPATPARHG